MRRPPRPWPNFLGFAARPSPQAKQQAEQTKLPQSPVEQVASPPEPEFTPAQPLLDIPFWRVEFFETLAEAEVVEQPLEAAEANVIWHNRPQDPPRIPMLAPWREVQAKLRKEAAQPQETRSLDVQQVSYEDIQRYFLPALNQLLPGFSLPSEAQWEYACRAGTQTALYSGDIEIFGDMDAPALDPIAWYGGNSGFNYDLDEWEDSTQGWWRDKRKQYDHRRAGTRKVKGKQANPWGLYDMLGNVWEWVADPWHENYEGAPADGGVWASEDAGAARVVRGGAWVSDAGVCRSAYRLSLPPDVRGVSLGFRCARVQA